MRLSLVTLPLIALIQFQSARMAPCSKTAPEPLCFYTQPPPPPIEITPYSTSALKAELAAEGTSCEAITGYDITDTAPAPDCRMIYNAFIRARNRVAQVWPT